MTYHEDFCAEEKKTFECLEKFFKPLDDNMGCFLIALERELTWLWDEKRIFNNFMKYLKAKKESQAINHFSALIFSYSNTHQLLYQMNMMKKFEREQFERRRREIKKFVNSLGIETVSFFYCAFFRI